MTEKAFPAVGLDLGSSRTRCAVCLVEDEHLRFLGHGDCESRGWVKSRVADQNAVTDCILEVLRQAEARAQLSIDAVTVGFGGTTVRGANGRSRIELGRPREIEQRDVNRALDRAWKVQLREDRVVLQLFPQDFIVEDQPGHRDPRHMLAQRLEANAHLITGSIQEHNCLIGAVNQAHVAVEETVYEPLAAHFASILPEDRHEGTALVDIGAHSTDLVVYYGESLQLASSLPICGDHFTRDVALACKISYEDAQLAKEEYGCATAEFTAENSLVEVLSAGDRVARELPRRLLNEIIEARARELFKYVRRELARVGMERSLVGGVVLAGGGARLASMCDVAESVLGCQARNGLPVGIRDWPPEMDSPSWATAAGLAMYSAKLKVQGEMERQSVGLLARILR
ncbi:MAG TPA: cell division protein FtsA [Bryobacteraceae bacterium]|nr:cell division protein FtsA [Bryobacteraceae bacterium]